MIFGISNYLEMALKDFSTLCIVNLFSFGCWLLTYLISPANKQVLFLASSKTINQDHYLQVFRPCQWVKRHFIYSQKYLFFAFVFLCRCCSRSAWLVPPFLGSAPCLPIRCFPDWCLPGSGGTLWKSLLQISITHVAGVCSHGIFYFCYTAGTSQSEFKHVTQLALRSVKERSFHLYLHLPWTGVCAGLDLHCDVGSCGSRGRRIPGSRDHCGQDSRRIQSEHSTTVWLWAATSERGGPQNTSFAITYEGKHNKRKHLKYFFLEICICFYTFFCILCHIVICQNIQLTLLFFNFYKPSPTIFFIYFWLFSTQK